MTNARSAVELLRELLRLKDLHDRMQAPFPRMMGKEYQDAAEEYDRCKPLAWAAARAFLAAEPQQDNDAGEAKARNEAGAASQPFLKDVSPAYQGVASASLPNRLASPVSPLQQDNDVLHAKADSTQGSEIGVAGASKADRSASPIQAGEGAALIERLQRWADIEEGSDEAEDISAAADLLARLAAERDVAYERCAKVCEDYGVTLDSSGRGLCKYLATSIRASK